VPDPHQDFQAWLEYKKQQKKKKFIKTRPIDWNNLSKDNF
jgi:hypothetical protein